MQIYPGADLIECEIVGRPLCLPLLREGRSAMLIDCGTREHAATSIPNYLNELGIEADDLSWLIITHPHANLGGQIGWGPGSPSPDEAVSVSHLGALGKFRKVSANS